MSKPTDAPAVLDQNNLTNHTNHQAMGLNPSPKIGYSADVMIEGKFAIPAGSKFLPHDLLPPSPQKPPHADFVFEGCPTVFCNGKPLGRVADRICGNTGPDTGGRLRVGAVSVKVPDKVGIPAPF